ncbi:histone methyltransferase set1 [Vermiconidia calcicola]|uniref:Histone methyltransferase set1 n=1 Tax=Vermiconidia calcicola TaxID=1690605 RepID=A0ACC3MTL1_9PEZI|nr:histone methyltransferase set1 [Vermiconidia calcicola]
MSQPGGAVEATSSSISPGSLKRKRDSTMLSHSHPSPTEVPVNAKLTNGTTSHSGLHLTKSSSTASGHSITQYTSPDSDETHHSDPGDLLRGVGSASSLNSTASSVFSHNSQAFAHNRKASLANGLTPLTNHTDSSPPKGNSPHYAKSATGMASTNGALATSHLPASEPTLELSQPRTERPQMLPSPGKARGYKVVWDPELDNKLSKEERKRAAPRKREFGTETYQPDSPPDPRLAIPGYMSGNCRSKNQPSKAILRIAPYNQQPYKQDKYSVLAEAQQVVATGFDPFLPESILKLNFGTFGSIASVQNKTDPETGSFLGIALIKYRDSGRGDSEMTAAQCAKLAEGEFNGQRIGLHTVRVELDREGRKFNFKVEQALKKAREERAKARDANAIPPPPPPDSGRPSSDSPAPPINAPKGPSGRAAPAPSPAPAVSIPSGPKAIAPPPNPRSAAASLIEDQPILSKIKRKPYIHISQSCVPVLGTTIPHLKKRLKAYDWREIRLDRTGYYVVFEDSKRGEDETERCFSECNKQALFTYSMEMECQKYGNPNYERSPSPERVMAVKQKREYFERLKREEAEDFEIEKKNRAENLDPVHGAIELLRAELRDRIMADIKTRIAIPVFHDSLEPARHTTKRRKLGLPDPFDNENKAPGLLYNKAGDTPPHTPKSRFGYPSKPLRPHDPNSQRGRQGERTRGPANAFVDERRRKPAPKPSHARGLHFRLQQMFAEDEDSDDERHTSITRDTEDQESRPLSRASRTSTPFDSESVTDTPKHKRRKVADPDEEEKETFNDFQRSMLGHLLHKEPEDLATRELEVVIGNLPRDSKYATRARTELYIRQRSKDDDDLFQVKSEPKKFSDDFADILEKEQESTPTRELDTKALKEKAKKKRKTKKEILAEQEALKAEAKKAKAASKPVAIETVTRIEEKELELEAVEEEIQPTDVHLRYTQGDKPRRTVEDEQDLVLDIDGWQHAIKDDEDLAFLKKALAEEAMYDVGDEKLWAWKQKEIKVLNSGARGAVQAETGIEGYYIPNATGCARTEGVKKILNEEKSKYLPHRIKVQRAREERQALAKANPTAAAEAVKLAAAEKMASTATSRSNRVNNRRLVNDINLQKQTLAATSNSNDADVAIRFNQLKKRKKLVKFDRSAIHGWGLYAEENIPQNDLIIEYVGEKVRQKVADLREIKYEKQGVGSSYLFRMMDDEIVDATKKGGIARFINHSCNPNCTAKIIKVEGIPRIVIYALKDIAKNEELTYDYKFEREIGSTDRIPCLCGSANCKGFLN